jgi:ketosteroid isomerase-like protein
MIGLTVWGSARPVLAWQPPVPAPPSVAQSVAARQIEQIELTFAQTEAQIGIAAAFRRFAAPAALMFLPDPIAAGPILRTAHWPGDLMRRPRYIGVAPSGDLAFSAGPSLLRIAGQNQGGFYLTVWTRSPGGAWQWVLDHGVDMPAAAVDSSPRPVTILSIDAASPPDLSEGLREADAALDADLAKQVPAPFAARLDDQILVARTDRPVAFGRRKALRLLADAPTILEAQLLHGGISLDGTLGYAYGKARWMTAAGPQQGYYVRIWRNAGQGWRLLVDHLAER